MDMTKSEYVILHRNLRKTLGGASDHYCVICGKSAQEWAQTHDTDPYVFSNYHPRCRSCHRKYDLSRPETKEKMKVSNSGKSYRGRKLSDETRAKMRVSALERWAKRRAGK